MTRTIYDCWNCRHHNSDNPYGIDYCELHDTRCSFAHDDCDGFEPDDDGSHRHRQPQPPCRLSLIGWYLLAVLVTIMTVLMLAGCTTTKYVPIIEHHTDTLIQTQHHRDSIYMHDSIHVREKGDTIRIERWHTQYRDRWRHDTVYIAKTDSVPRPYPVEVVREVAKPLTWWQQTRMYVGGIVIFGLIIFAVWKIYVTLHPRL